MADRQCRAMLPPANRLNLKLMRRPIDMEDHDKNAGRTNDLT